MTWVMAWRNIWRNKKRSTVLLMAVAFGLWAGIVSSAFSWGAVDQMVAAAVQDRTAHLQIHLPGFRTHRQIQDVIPDGFAVLDSVRRTPGVKAVSGRVVITGMVASPKTSSGVIMMGVVPADERRVSEIYARVKSGDYFGTGVRNPIVISDRLAAKLNVRDGNKVVLTAQAGDGSISGGAFRIVGLFRTVSSEFDKTTVFAQREDLERVFGLVGALHEIAVLADEPRKVDELAKQLKHAYPELDVATWKDIEPEMGLTIGYTEEWVLIFIGIILLALVFGITNTMLMAVLERVREFGVVIALGMSHARIFGMILLETLLLSLTGAVVGIAMGAATVAILAHTGVNLAMVESGLEAFGISAVVFPALPPREYVIIGILVIATGVLAAIYPGVKAARLHPVDAIRST